MRTALMLLASALLAFLTSDTHAQRNRPDRPAGPNHRTPAAAQQPIPRPTSRPSGLAARPGQRPTPRPPQGQRPGGLAPKPIPRPGQRPNDRPNAGNRPSPTRPAPRPSPEPGPIVRPRPLPDTRPNNRPNTRPGGGNRPIVRPDTRPETRPGPRPPWSGGRPDINIGNRKDINIGNRQNIINSGNRITNVNNRVVNNRVVNNRTVVNRPVYNRPGYARPWYGYNDRWYRGGWGWNTRPNFWYGAAAAVPAGWMMGAIPNVVYSNPYYSAPTTVVVPPSQNYAQPIASPPVIVQTAARAYSDDSPVSPSSDTPRPVADLSDDQPVVSPEVVDEFDDARAAFKRGDMDQALDLINKAIDANPSDSVMHEFRALVLFAQKKYQDAAAGIYAVLSVGPGWDWETLRSLYADANTYTAQLRALEAYRRDHPKDGAATFLLAYHYLCLNDRPAAIKMLEKCVELTPQDKLSAELLKTLKQDGNNRPASQVEG